MITFQTYDLPEDKGWRLIMVAMILDGKQIGYAKIQYIPKKNFKYLYPSAFEFAVHRRNQYFHHSWLDTPVEEWADERLLEAYGIFNRNWTARWCPIPSREECITNIHESKKRAIIVHKKEFMAFKKWHLDKPEMSSVFLNVEHQGQGKGTKLYTEVIRVLKAEGLTLHASSLLNDYSRRVWASMEAKGMIGEENGRRYVL